MRLSFRLLLPLKITLLAFCVVACPRAPLAQTPAQLPPQWTDAVSQLADKIASEISPTAVTLDVESISSLDPPNVAAIGTALQSQLQRHSFSVISSNSQAAESAVSLQLTLSESVGEYVWVIQIFNHTSKTSAIPALIVSVPKSDFTEAEKNEQSLALDKRLVWKQPERFLDFAILKPPSGQPSLLVLETRRLVVYKLSGSEWQLSHTTSIPQAGVPSRDPDGTINLKAGNISLNGLDCVGDPDLAGVVVCKAAKPNNRIGTRVKISGLPNSLGTLVQGECRGETISLYTGEGDWSQKDTIQGYLINLNLFSAATAGDAIQVNGPVITLGQEQDAASAARAIVRNLKTGNYEGYIVTATCSH
ncbi:MAG: hypothetical protein WA785_01935 [Candidatus Acidiferrales bacterium]